MIELLQGISFVEQGMIWVADYSDGTYLFEFDRNTKNENNFYEIDKNKLIKFGLIGHEYNCHYDIFGGIFNINGRKINIKLLTDDFIHEITGQNLLYNDIITYKEASAKFDLSAKIIDNDSTSLIRSAKSEIDAFNIGYKQQFISNGIIFHSQIIASFPYVNVPHIKIRISADKEVIGKLVVMVDNSTSLECMVNLKENIGGEINWQMAL